MWEVDRGKFEHGSCLTAQAPEVWVIPIGRAIVQSLDEYLRPHELLESLLVENWFHSGEHGRVAESQDLTLRELLQLLVQVPQLEDVYEGDVVSLHTIWTLQPVAPESLQLACVLTERSLLPCIRNDLCVRFSVDLQLAFDSK